MFHFTASDAGLGVWAAFAASEDRSELLGLLGVEGQVIVSTPNSQMFHLLSNLLVVLAGQTSRWCWIRAQRAASIEQRTEYAALWDTCAQH